MATTPKTPNRTDGQVAEGSATDPTEAPAERTDVYENDALYDVTLNAMVVIPETNRKYRPEQLRRAKGRVLNLPQFEGKIASAVRCPDNTSTTSSSVG